MILGIAQLHALIKRIIIKKKPLSHSYCSNKKIQVLFTLVLNKAVIIQCTVLEYLSNICLMENIILFIDKTRVPWMRNHY